MSVCEPNAICCHVNFSSPLAAPVPLLERWEHLLLCMFWECPATTGPPAWSLSSVWLELHAAAAEIIATDNFHVYMPHSLYLKMHGNKFFCDPGMFGGGSIRYLAVQLSWGWDWSCAGVG